MRKRPWRRCVSLALCLWPRLWFRARARLSLPLLAVGASWLGGAAWAAYPPPLVSRSEAVATDHPLASQAGLAALAEGGNAVDAACRAAMVLGVVSPAASGIGGGGFMLLHRAKERSFVVLDFRERAPAGWTEEHTAKGRSATEHGGLSIAVPGEVAGLAHAVAKYGRLPWRKCVATASKLARNGFAVSHHLAATVKYLAEPLGRMPALGEIFVPAGKPVTAGSRIKLPKLGATLGRIAANAHSFYQGPLAKKLVAAVRAQGGILSEADLLGYEVRILSPVEGKYRGLKVVAMPPPSSGGTTLIEALQILEHFKLTPLGSGSSALLHVVAEALKHAYADRSRFIADPLFTKVPLEKLLSPSYAAELARRIDSQRTRPAGEYGTPAPSMPLLDGGTSHLSIVDKEGNALSLTTTINTPFGSFVVAGDTGVLLNNEMDDFVPDAASPNRAAPGKTPLSSMSPTIILRNDEPYIVVGASGGQRIITATLQALVQVIDFGLDASAAVASPRMHVQWPPNDVELDRDIPLDVANALTKRGHIIRTFSAPSAVQMIVIAPGRLESASDPRKGGAPAGR